MDFSHLDSNGKAKMVDVSSKPPVRRTASAEGRIMMSPKTLKMIRENTIAKGDVLSVAKIAGIQGAKQTSDLIPLCHNIEIDCIDLAFEFLEKGVRIHSTAVCTDKTGIEMEALTAVSIAALTIYDMCKAVDKSMKIEGIELIKKTKDQPSGTDPRYFDIVSINISEKRGEQKMPVETAVLKESWGIEKDAHGGDWHRQISLLADEDVDTMRKKGLEKGVELKPGDFAENITTRGVNLLSLSVGTRFFIDETELEVTQHGKTCHHDCNVYKAIGECVMPKRGIFAKVIKGGEISRESRGYYCI